MSPSNPTIQRAKDFGNPVIRGDRATFIWEGKTAPHLISDLHGWEENPKPFKRLSQTLAPAFAKTIWSECSSRRPRRRFSVNPAPSTGCFAKDVTEIRIDLLQKCATPTCPGRRCQGRAHFYTKK